MGISSEQVHVYGSAKHHVFGVRHHGPGSARSLVAALDALRPDALLVEGPPDAGDLLPLVLSSAMQPPVALLIYPPDEPTYAAYYPFAEYSPEWQAIRWGLSHQLLVQMIDLPQSVQMAMNRAPAQQKEPPAGKELPEEKTSSGEKALDESNPPAGEEPPPALYPLDPLLVLAEAAGYSESEQWWEHLVEQRREPSDLFAAILEAITALREAAPPETQPVALAREAAMREGIRAALSQGYERVAVVCGAWHTPALTDLDSPEYSQEKDNALLNGLPEMDVRATWVPWTNARLSRHSGYGAGVNSPGWYAHLWSTSAGSGSGVSARDVAVRWLIRAARLLRAEDLDISSAHVIEAVRLAEALAALRDHPLPGLAELNEAVLTVFCAGNPMPMRLIEDRLITGDALGSVPPKTPMAPLQQDFERETRRLKLAPEAYEKSLDLDLRRTIDLERSHLLHRLNLLGIPWGRANDALQATGPSYPKNGRSGTFHEIWRLKWQPDYPVLLIEAGGWGSTIAIAASARVCQSANSAANLSGLTRMVEDVLLAELPGTIEHVMTCLQAQAAVSSEMRHLMQALPSLVSVLRYGSVRQTDTAMITQVIDGLVERIFIGLPGACSALDDEAAAEMFELVLRVNDAINRLANNGYSQDWQRGLNRLVELPNIHALVAGRATRILSDTGRMPVAETARCLNVALSTANDPLKAATWIEGFLRGSGQLLIHDGALLGVINDWLVALPEPVFIQLLPLLRRTFSTFAYPERRGIGERIKRGQSPYSSASPEPTPDFDSNQADAVLPLLAKLLGINPPDSPMPTSRISNPTNDTHNRPLTARG